MTTEPPTPETILATHQDALKRLGQPESLIRQSLKEEYDDVSAIGRYYGDRRWRLVTLFTSISFALAGFSLQRFGAASAWLGVIGSAALQVFARFLFTRFAENSRAVNAYLGALGTLIGFHGHRYVAQRREDESRVHLRVSTILDICIILHALAFIAALVAWVYSLMS